MAKQKLKDLIREVDRLTDCGMELQTAVDSVAYSYDMGEADTDALHTAYLEWLSGGDDDDDYQCIQSLSELRVERGEL